MSGLTERMFSLSDGMSGWNSIDSNTFPENNIFQQCPIVLAVTQSLGLFDIEKYGKGVYFMLFPRC